MSPVESPGDDESPGDHHNGTGEDILDGPAAVPVFDGRSKRLPFANAILAIIFLIGALMVLVVAFLAYAFLSGGFYIN